MAVDTLVVPSNFDYGLIARIPVSALTSLTGGSTFAPATFMVSLTSPAVFTISPDGTLVYVQEAGLGNTTAALSDGTVSATINIQVSPNVSSMHLNGKKLILAPLPNGAPSLAQIQNVTSTGTVSSGGTISTAGIHVVRDAGVW